MNRVSSRPLSGPAIVLGLMLAVAAITPSLADGNILGGFLNALGSAMVLGSWQKVDAQTQDCLASRFNMNPADLAQQGIMATDVRVTPYIQQCQQLATSAGPGDQQPQQASLEHSQGPADDRQRLAYLTGRFGKKHAVLLVQGQIGLGMSQEEVILAWGEPNAKELQGKAGELWNYGDDKVVFTKGKVSGVTH